MTGFSRLHGPDGPLPPRAAIFASDLAAQRMAEVVNQDIDRYGRKEQEVHKAHKAAIFGLGLGALR